MTSHATICEELRQIITLSPKIQRSAVAPESRMFLAESVVRDVSSPMYLTHLEIRGDTPMGASKLEDD